jgi:hypothetical protein
MKFKTGVMYYVRIKEKMFSSHNDILNIFILRGSHTYKSIEGSKVRILDCTPLASNSYLDWDQLPVREILEVKEISIEDLPLYLNLEKQTPTFQELLKKGLPHEAV